MDMSNIQALILALCVTGAGNSLYKDVVAPGMAHVHQASFTLPQLPDATSEKAVELINALKEAAMFAPG